MQVQTGKNGRHSRSRPGLCHFPVAGLPLSARSGWYSSFKSAAEFVAALLLLVVSAPLVTLAALVVRLTSPGPAFYSQIRLGRNGKPFRLYKLRTMLHDCEALTGARWAISGDPRVTRFGWFLRKSHLDEFPQLWNVLRGEMSLIGPRPERPEFIPQLEHAIPHYRERLMVRPGITGLAQLQIAPDTDFDSVRLKLAYDRYYIRHCRPWLDVQILLGTVLHMVGLPFWVAGTLLRIPSGAVVEDTFLAPQAEGELVPQLQPA